MAGQVETLFNGCYLLRPLGRKPNFCVASSGIPLGDELLMAETVPSCPKRSQNKHVQDLEGRLAGRFVCTCVITSGVGQNDFCPMHPL